MRKIKQSVENRFAENTNGNIAIMFAFTFSLLMLFTGGALDFARYNAVRADLIESLDASGLAMAQLDAMNGPELRNLSDSERKEYLKAYGKDFFFENFNHEDIIDGLSIDYDIDNTKITPRAQGTLKTLLLHVGTDLLGLPGGGFESLAMTTDTEITRAATGNTEVTLVLDTTGSMNSGSKMSDLKDAANEFVDILIRNDQSQFYSKVAVVPYGGSVNLGAAQAAVARGPILPAKSITGINKNSKVTITAPNHGFVNNDYIVIKNVNGMTQINNTGENVYRVQNATANTFQIKKNTGSTWVDSSSYSNYASGGEIYCASGNGCRYNYFVNQSGSRRLFEITSCVSERNGAQAYTDAGPAGATFGRVYGPIGGAYMCPPSQAVGLTANRTQAHATINALAANGNTGGHVGVAWGWYAVSPNFASMFTGDSAPAAYDDDVAKSIVLMTDGEYNSSYCNGVVSQSSTSGSGGSTDHINCNAPNGHSFDQAQSLCAAMKTAGVTVYTVGFQIVNDQRARDLMTNCATGPSYAYLAEDGAALKRVFADIAQNIAKLHVSR